MKNYIDHYNDPRCNLLAEIAQDRPDLVPLYKTASVTGDSSHPDSAFADPDMRRFPIHTAPHAVLSKLYAEKQASAVPAQIRERIDTALALHGYNPEKICLSGTVKTANVAEPHYLLPQYRRLAIRSREDVPRAAEHLMEQKHRLKMATTTGAAARLVKIAADQGMSTDDLPLDVFKYAGLTSCDAGLLLDWVEARSEACKTLEQRQVFDKIASAIKVNFPKTGVLRDRDELIKIATHLETADQRAGLHVFYGKTLLDPMQTVFNMDKVAEVTVSLGGKEIPLTTMMAVPADVYEEILGEGVVEAAMGPDGSIDPEQFHALLTTLPADLKSLLYTTLFPYLTE